ncbi:imelysin family protein [Hahella ganghwensis]|uniref:imelysin family protein n=1 Tax=Hahella ganghwensis TaxID=286420 RepID=UPI000378287E|nr:imelysin family protein [Hahella ganghwensis]
MRYCLLILCLVLSTLSYSAERDPDIYLKLLGQGLELILPAHQTFADQTVALKKQTEELCQVRTQESLDAAQKQWRSTMEAWMRVSVLQFGPLLENDQRLRIQAWPIRARLLTRGINQLESSETPPTLESIAHGTVAIQGLPALEVFLFRDNALTALEKGQACPALQTVARHLVVLAKELNNRWQGDFGKDFGNPAGIPGGFDTPQQAYDEYMNGLVTAVQQIKRRKLEDPLGLAGRPGKANATESYLSGNSRANLHNSLNALIEFLTGGQGYGVEDDLLDQDPDGIAALILNDRLNGITKYNSQLTMPLEDLVKPATAEAESQREVVISLFKELSLLNRAFENQLFDALGVTRDFNSEDGD